MISRLSKIVIILCSVILTVVFCYEPFASGMTEEPDSSSEITLPESTVSKVDYSSSSDERQNDLAELTIEAYIDPDEKIEEVTLSDVMVVFDESLDAAESRSDILSGIKSVIDKLPDAGSKGESHRVCLLGYSKMENTGYYTYNKGAQFNKPISGVDVWKDYSADSLTGLPAILRRYNRSLPSYDKCFLSKDQALEVLNHPAQMNEWVSKESRADAGLVLSGKFIKKRNMALTSTEREARPLIVIFAASSIPTQVVNGEKISRAESIKTAKNQIISNCENYGVTPSFYSIGDCSADGFDEMMAEVAGGADNHFSLGNVGKLSKKLNSILKKSSDKKSREIEITTSKFKDSNGEEKSFADLKNQYNFNLKEATVKSYTLQKNSDGEEDWVEDSEKISAKKVSASDDVLSCRVSIDQTAELATYSTESSTETTEEGPPRRVIIEITTFDKSVHEAYIHIRSIDENGNNINEKFSYYLKYITEKEDFSNSTYESWRGGISDMVIDSYTYSGYGPNAWIVEQFGNPDYEPTEAWIYNGSAKGISLTNVPPTTDDGTIPDGWTKVPKNFVVADNTELGGAEVNIKISDGTTLNGTKVVKPEKYPEYTLVFKNKKKEEKASRNMHLELKYSQKINIPETTAS